jgi:DNA primase
VAYCEEAAAEYPLVNGRIITPVTMNGECVGWQARAPFECDWGARHIPKYYNLPGMPKTSMLYGYDQAVGEPFCIVVEGVTDVWRVGVGAIATFGKTLSFSQAELIYQNWKKVVIAYDSDAHEYVERAKMMLESKMDVVPMLLPSGDPASIPNEEFWTAVLAAADECRIDLLGRDTN